MQFTDNEHVIYKKLYEAVKENNKDLVVNILIANRVALSKTQKTANLALIAASRYGQLSLVEQILTDFSSMKKRDFSSCFFFKKPNVNEKVLNIDEAFKAASANGHTEICRFLLINHSAYLNDQLFSRALKLSVLGGHLRSTSFLLRSLDYLLDSNLINTTFLYACKTQHIEIMKLIFAREYLNEDALNKAFILATEDANFTSLDFLLKKESIVKIKNFSVQISFLNAVARGNIAVVDYLLKPRMYYLANYPSIERSLVDWSLRSESRVNSWNQTDDEDLERMLIHVFSIFQKAEENVALNIKSYNLSKGNIVSESVEAIYKLCFPERHMAINLQQIERDLLEESDSPTPPVTDPSLIDKEGKRIFQAEINKKPTKRFHYFLPGSGAATIHPF